VFANSKGSGLSRGLWLRRRQGRLARKNVVDKIKAFEGWLADRRTSLAEGLLALNYLLTLIERRLKPEPTACSLRLVPNPASSKRRG
jgi:hypothetical protein